MRVLKTVGMLAVLSAAVVLVGCSAGGAGANASPTATRTPAPAVPSPATGFTTFTSSDGVYGLNYPSDWSTALVNKPPVVNGEIFESPDSALLFMALPLNTSVASDQYGAFASSFAGGFGGTGTKISSSTTTTSFAGKTWTEVDGATTVKGTTCDLKIYGTALGSNTIFIVTVAPSASSSTAFQSMFSSFTFLKQG